MTLENTSYLEDYQYPEPPHISLLNLQEENAYVIVDRNTGAFRYT